MIVEKLREAGKKDKSDKLKPILVFLERLGPDHGDAYAFCCSHTSPRVRTAALKGFEKVDADGLSVHSTILIKCAKDEDTGVSKRAIDLIGKLLY